MPQQRDKRVMSLVHACADLPPAERDAFLAAECGPDTDLRSQIIALLAEDGARTGVHPSTERLANALPEHYKLTSLIGSGGMAEVYLAEDTRLHRKVAIKILNDALRSDPERMARFVQEARSASSLNHPNIITIHDIGEADGVQYIVSEFVDGETLATRMTRGRIPISDAVEIAASIASALDASHHAGIVHRDLKPENIMLRADGGLKVVDFGLAKGSGIFAQNGHSSQIVTTSPGLVLGTPRYMSPEQTRGMPLDGRSDIFSLGITLFEMITGRTPFPGATIADTFAAILRHDPRPISDFVKDPPQKLVKIVERSLRKDPEERYRSMAALLADLQDLRLDLTLPTRSLDRPAETTRVNLRRFIGLGAIAALLVLLTAGWWYFSTSGQRTVTTGAMRNVAITTWASVSADAVTAASFSPDAKMVAFGSTRSGASEIWSKPTTGGEPIQVTRDGFYNQYPVWSPDGQEIAFFSSRGATRGLWKVSFSGGQETQLASGLGTIARPLRWTSAGVLLQDGNEVVLLDTASGDRKPMTELTATGIHPRAFAVSFDGKAFAVSLKDGDTWRLNYKRFSDASFVTIANSKEQIDGIAFHPNGSSIFYSTGIDGTQQIFETTTSGAVPVQVSNGGSDLSLHDISPDGNRILYGTINETSDLWAIDLKDAASNVVANDPTEEYWADFAPDGKGIVYQTAAQADRPYRGSIVIRQLQSKSPAAVIAQDGFAPVWSPDGQWIAFFKRTDSGIAVWKVRPSGADASKIAEGEIGIPGYSSTPYLKLGTNHLTWQPDSKAVIYAGEDGGASNIWIAPIDGPSPTAVLRVTDGQLCCAALGRNGRIAVVSEPSASGDKVWRLLSVRRDGADVKEEYRSESAFRLLGYDAADDLLVSQKADQTEKGLTPSVTRIFRISPDGKVTSPLSLSFAYSHNINLSPDGRTIFFVTRTNDTSEIWSAPSSGGAAVKIVGEADPKVLISALAVAADGKTVMFGKQTRTNVLSMLTN